ncbi:MAG: hypothetical protein CFE43_07655 [Burkholderiales bacterium PBB3]|nr:MAG: hypothetical protein CFE43_07655 [Burkholderiales bacterium PBB3]
MTKNLKTRSLLAMVTLLALTACGGGTDYVATPTPMPGPVLVMGTDLPTTVEQSAMSLVDFAKTQLTATSETTDPLVVGEAKLAVDDTAEPSDV